MISDYHSEIFIPLYWLIAKPEGRGGQVQAFLGHCSLDMPLLKSLLFLYALPKIWAAEFQGAWGTESGIEKAQ